MKEEINIFAIDKLSYKRTAPKTKVLEWFAAQWGYVLYFVIIGIIICAISETEFSIESLMDSIQYIRGKGKVFGVIAVIACFLNWFTPLLTAFMLNSTGKYNKLLKTQYQLSKALFGITIGLQFAGSFFYVLIDFCDTDIVTILALIVMFAAAICQIILACKIRKKWRDTDDDLEAIGNTWFIFFIVSVILMIFSIAASFIDNMYVMAGVDVLFVILDIYLFSKMKDQLEDIGICFRVERNRYVLEHPDEFTKEQYQEVQQWNEEVQRKIQELNETEN